MRTVVIGAGAIGGVVGAQLHRAGHDVTLVARGRHLEALRENGLRLCTPGDDVVLPIRAVGAAREVDWRGDEVILLAVKSHQSAAALEELLGSAGDRVPVVCLQNGVANERLATRWFPRVYGCCVMCPATHLAPGVVEASSQPLTGLLDLGRYPFGVDETARGCAAALEEATFESIPRPDIMRWKYAKLLLNLANVVEALCDPSPAAGQLARLARSEGRRCFEAAGIAVASSAEDRRRRGDRLRLQPVAGRERTGGSTWQSLARGTGSVETDYLNGEVVALGRLHGIPTPANALLQAEGRRAAANRLEPGTLRAEDLLAALGAEPAASD